MLRGLAQYVGGKIFSALLFVTLLMGAVWYWNLPAEARDAIWRIVQGAAVWTAFVAVMPWALFFVPPLVVKAERNWVSAVVLLAYLAADVGFALYLTGGHLGTTMPKGVLLVGFLSAGVYNFLVCEYLAGRAEDAI